MGNTPSAPTTPTVTVVTPEANNVKSQNDSSVEKYLILAQNAYKIRNFPEALSYVNKILELDPTHSRAWFLKGSSLCWATTIQQGITLEMINCYAQAENNCTDEAHDALMKEMGNDIWHVSYGLITTACNLFRQNPEGYVKNVIWLYDNILKTVPGLVEICLDKKESKVFIKDVTSVLWGAAVETYNAVRNDRWDPHNYFSYYHICAWTCQSLLERCAEVTELSATDRWKLYNNVETICVDAINDYPPGYFEAMENSREIFLRGYTEGLDQARRQMSILKPKTTKKSSSQKTKATKNPETHNESTEPKTPKKTKEPTKPKEPEVVYWEDVFVTDDPSEIPSNFEFFEAITKGSLWSGIASDYGIKKAVEKIQKAAADKGCHLVLITEVNAMFGVSVSADLYKAL